MQLLEKRVFGQLSRNKRKEFLNTESTSGQAIRHKDIPSGIKKDIT
jgi:hypothetical protein